jgi:hypothetical protein
VTANSPTDVWTVGDLGRGNGGNLIEHRDGTSWSVIAGPGSSATGSNTLAGMTVLGSGPVVAVGTGYDGSGDNNGNILRA